MLQMKKYLFAFFLSLSVALQAQQVSNSTLSGAGTDQANVSSVNAIISSQQTLAQSFASLVEQGATVEQLKAWQSQNAAKIAFQQQAAIANAINQPSQALFYVNSVNIPPDASQSLASFLIAGANLFNLRVQLYNQQIKNTGTVNEGSVDALYQQQNAAAIQAQAQLVQTIAQESVAQTMPLPPPIAIPPQASPQLKALLLLNNQITRDRITLWNQSTNVPLDQRKAIFQNWEQQNAARFQQLQQLALSLSTSN